MLILASATEGAVGVAAVIWLDLLTGGGGRELFSGKKNQI